MIASSRGEVFIIGKGEGANPLRIAKDPIKPTLDAPSRGVLIGPRPRVSFTF